MYDHENEDNLFERSPYNYLASLTKEDSKLKVSPVLKSL